MDRSKEPQMSYEQAKEVLDEAKERLAGQGEKLSLKETMAKHPYLSLGAAFLTGAVAGGSREAREEVTRAVIDAFSRELFHKK